LSYYVLLISEPFAYSTSSSILRLTYSFSFLVSIVRYVFSC